MLRKKAGASRPFCWAFAGRSAFRHRKITEFDEKTGQYRALCDLCYIAARLDLICSSSLQGEKRFC
jgi:hypothetical protein